ncbi:ATP-binding protein [Corynebacterium guangdongense]|uniref:Orc1-like AAA ATPase domain-containing protein n=1 Tax=Corynebacterium guangdongense TaxID=1783348 RepID=A0ABU1ZXA4_9CORY|nr:ATP-binding protein [Corynebacterium guangdongense]MDR7329572.1 hypothetical protein [Corynebacterium guangdongense]WJZ18137.1 hypothetical protein CGUA_07875 [Corynebacterium guangdongense]
MSPRNPFRPTFGASPHHWAGRQTILDDFREGIADGPGDPHRSLIISGARGIGKTVLLTELEDIAAEAGWIVLRATGREDTVDVLVDSTIPEKIRQLDPPATRALTGVGVTGLGRIEVDRIAEDKPAPTLTSRMRELLSLLRGAGVLITVDEVQDADPDALSALANGYQDLVRDDEEVALVMAGLSHGVGQLLDLPGTTFLRRARRYELGPLTDTDAAVTLRETAESGGLPFVERAVPAAVDIARGYPYLVQLVGYLAFRTAARDGSSAISRSAVEAIREEAVETMGVQVHHPSLKGLPPAQLNYLQAMSDLVFDVGDDAAAVSTSEIAAELGKTPNATTDTRGKLLERGLIDAAGWGRVAFTLPYMANFLRGGGRINRIS